MYKIFFAHSDPKLVGIYQPYLREHFMVDSAHNGLQALRKIRLSAPHLIVSDYQLPMLSGLSLLKFVRSTPRFVHIPFIFLTDHHEGIDLGLSHAASEWIVKKDSYPDQVMERIYHHLKLNRHNHGL